MLFLPQTGAYCCVQMHWFGSGTTTGVVAALPGPVAAPPPLHAPCDATATRWHLASQALASVCVSAPHTGAYTAAHTQMSCGGAGAGDGDDAVVGGGVVFGKGVF